SAEPPATTNEPRELVPAARTKAPIASAIATAPTTSVDRPTTHPRVAGSPPATPPGCASTGSSRTRHGVALGSTHRPPRRDGRATTPRCDATSRHVGGTSDAARRRRANLLGAPYLRLIRASPPDAFGVP